MLNKSITNYKVGYGFMKCYFKKIQSLKRRNIEVIYECKDVNYVFPTIEDLTRLVYEITSTIAKTLSLNIEKLMFIENEPIGLNYIIIQVPYAV